ncbi:MAG TPA: ABC transporter substrate-binding protein [Rhodocyclaceae bacterium]|nr:ABC transporter substrate-binding protein [Rhodocyclaceae bacterium]
MHRLTGVLRLAFAALGLVFVSACSEVAHAPLRVGVEPWVGFDPLVLAQDRRAVDPAVVRIVELGSGSESARNLRNGLVEAAALTLGETLRLVEEGLALRIVAVLDVSHGADAILADPSIRDSAGLRGKRIALEESAVAAMLLDRVLADGKLDAEDVRVLPTEASYHESALRSGRANAVITYEPMKSRLVASGYGVVFDSSRMPDEVVDVLVVRAEVLEARPQAVDSLVSAWAAGLAELRAAPARAAELLSSGIELTPEEYLATLDGLRFMDLADSVDMLSGQPAPLARSGAKLADTLLRLGLIRTQPDWAALLAPESVARVVGRGGAAR